jgi:hypothetical protein
VQCGSYFLCGVAWDKERGENGRVTNC